MQNLRQQAKDAQFKERLDTANKAEERINWAYQQVFSSDEGERVIKDLLQYFDIPLQVPGDPYATHVHIGFRTIIDHIQARIKGEANAT